MYYHKIMECIFDKKKLEPVLSDFYNSTEIAVALYDASRKIVASSPAYTPYCSYIRGQDKCMEHCAQSNLIHMKEVSLNRKISCYTCHAGLMETILPIVYDEVLIAYIQIGQFRDGEHRYSSPDKLRSIASRYALPLEQLQALYGKVPLVCEKKLRSLFDILDILIKSFWADGLIAYNRSMLSIKIEQYIDEHLHEKIDLTTICNKFFLSKNAAYRLFHNEFGVTVNDFIIKKRLQRAQELLRAEPELNVTQIAELCGFSDYNYFIRLFKKQVGSTPLRFRKSGRDATL